MPVVSLALLYAVKIETTNGHKCHVAHPAMSKIIEHPKLKGTHKYHQCPTCGKKPPQNQKPTLGLSLPWHNVRVCKLAPFQPVPADAGVGTEGHHVTSQLRCSRGGTEDNLFPHRDTGCARAVALCASLLWVQLIRAKGSAQP